jgi:hypothetical protein
MSERFVLQGNATVLDQETGLVWQRNASEDRMVWKDGFTYVDQLNKGEFAGFNDWRYPAKEEIETLIMPAEERQTGLYINPVFGTQRNCWSSTSAGHHRACYADFYYGDIYLIEENYANHFVRAVRGK